MQPNQHTASNVANHFTSEVRNIHASIADSEPPTISCRSTSFTQLSVLRTVTIEEAAKLLATAPSQHCSLDPVPSSLLKQASASVAPILASLCNQAFADSRLPMSEKHALVPARLKKPNLNPDDLNSYQPISNLSFTSKLVERAVAARFVAHCELNGLLPAKQSVYRRHHSTETAVLVVYTTTSCEQLIEDNSHRLYY